MKNRIFRNQNINKYWQRAVFLINFLYLKLEGVFIHRYNTSTNNIRSFVTKEEKQILYHYALSLSPNCIAVEIGSYLGASSSCLAEALAKNQNKLICIDTWNNDAVSDAKADVYSDWENSVKLYRTNITPIRGFSYDVIDLIPNNISLLFIDGDHSYEGVKKDILLYLPKMKKDGILIMHDWTQVGVKAVIEEFVQSSEIKRLLTLPNLYACRVDYHKSARK